MGTPNREPQEYSRNITGKQDPGRHIPVLFLSSWGSRVWGVHWLGAQGLDFRRGSPNSRAKWTPGPMQGQPEPEHTWDYDNLVENPMRPQLAFGLVQFLIVGSRVGSTLNPEPSNPKQRVEALDRVSAFRAQGWGLRVQDVALQWFTSSGFCDFKGWRVHGSRSHGCGCSAWF